MSEEAKLNQTTRLERPMDLSGFTAVRNDGTNQDEVYIPQNPDRNKTIMKLSQYAEDTGQAAKNTTLSFLDSCKRKVTSMFSGKTSKNPVLIGLTAFSTIFTAKSGLNFLREFSSNIGKKPNILFRSLEFLTGITASSGLISALLMKKGNKFITPKSAFKAAGIFGFFTLINNIARGKTPKLLKIFGFDKPIEDLVSSRVSMSKARRMFPEQQYLDPNGSTSIEATSTGL